MGFDVIFMECHMNLNSARPAGWLEVLDVSGHSILHLAEWFTANLHHGALGTGSG
jgi:hypothetical protein